MNDNFTFRIEQSNWWPPLPPPTWEDTIPLPWSSGDCLACLARGHVWSPEAATKTFPGTDAFGEHTLLRYLCECDMCFGRCAAQRFMIAATPTNTGLHRSPNRPPPEQLRLSPIDIPHIPTIPHHTKATQDHDPIPQPRQCDWLPAHTQTRTPA